MTERTSACSQCRTPRRRRAEDGSACPSLVAEAVGEAAFIGCAQERRAAGESGQREPWVARTMIGLPRIVNVVPAFALRREALAMAFNDLRESRGAKLIRTLSHSTERRHTRTSTATFGRRTRIASRR